MKSIRDHVDPEDKREISELETKSGGAQNGHPFKNGQKGTIYINKSGLYSLILHSKLEYSRSPLLQYLHLYIYTYWKIYLFKPFYLS